MNAFAQLQAGENVLAVLEVDLNQKLFFIQGLLLVTDRRLLGCGDDSVWHAWAYRTGLSLRHHDHAGVGHLELLDDTGRLASWRFTLKHNLQAVRLLDQFRIYLSSHVSGLAPALLEGRHCPTCKAPLAPDQDDCPVCTKVIYTPPSTWTLFRLWRFAKPYRGQLLAGFILTLLGTAASLVPIKRLRPRLPSTRPSQTHPVHAARLP